ncbi:dihydroorotate dehydrogenase [Pseudomonas orientalis]|uniref:dihydroorotate dehydrogenase n=1 Tax=Pseudomonas orientalis TaxID=76758 RepID=UPI000F01436E
MSNQGKVADYSVLGMSLKSPIIVGSGLLSDQAKNIRQLVRRGAGAVVTKTIYPISEKNHSERIYSIGTGLLNNTNYSKRKVDDWLGLLSQFKQERLPIIASVHAPFPDALGSLVESIREVSDCPLELGISCLHADDVMEDTPERVYAYAEAVRQQTDAHFSVKLSLGQSLHERVHAAIEGGASAVTLSDTISGIAFDLVKGKAVLGGICGYSGPGIKPMVLAAIYELRQRGITIPIMGSGGVQNGLDVQEYMLAGAETVQVYSALHNDMFTTLERITQEYQSNCDHALATETAE